MIKIKLPKTENFLKVAETLTRMGIANNQDKVLYQSCHILNKRNEYFIAHFKDMMALDGKLVQISDEDKTRTASIAKTLESWGLVEVVDNITNVPEIPNFRIIKHSQRYEWKLISKYKIGNSQ